MYTEHNHNDVVFESCHQINELLVNNDENEARQELIKLLDFHKQNELDYSSLVNHLIRQTGLYPYLQIEQANWGERYVYELFKADVGFDEPITLHREQSPAPAFASPCNRACHTIRPAASAGFSRLYNIPKFQKP